MSNEDEKGPKRIPLTAMPSNSGMGAIRLTSLSVIPQSASVRIQTTRPECIKSDFAPLPDTTPIVPVEAKKPVRPRERPPEQQMRPIVPVEPRYEPPELHHVMTTLEDQMFEQLEGALLRGDTRRARRVAQAGAAIGLNHPLAHAERKSRDKKRSAKFASAIKSSRKALRSARELESESAINRAVARVHKYVALASKNDPRGRTKQNILTQVGTSQEELDILPTISEFKPCVRSLWQSRTAIKETIVLNARSVEVIYLHGRPSTNKPIRKIASGEPIIPPLPVRERRASGHARSRTMGKIVRMRDVRRVLFAFIHEVATSRYVYLGVQLMSRKVMVYEVPWSDELLNGELVEIVRGLQNSPQPFLQDGGEALHFFA